MHYPGDLLRYHWNINSNLKSYTQQSSGAYCRALEGIEGGLFCMRSFMSIPPVDENPTTKSHLWRRISIAVRVKATYDSYCPNSFPICSGIIFVKDFAPCWHDSLRWLVDYYRFFCSEFKSDECQLRKFEHFCIFKVKGQFPGQIKLGTSVIPHFHVFWLDYPFLKLFWLFKVIFKVKRSISRSSKQKYHF